MLLLTTCLILTQDFKELLELCRIFLGGYLDVNEAKPSFRTPGAFHYARWMAKAIYSLKRDLFQKQFSLTAKEKRGIQELVLFVSLIYIRFWHEAPLAVKAPLNDLLLLFRNSIISKQSCCQSCINNFHQTSLVFVRNYGKSGIFL